MQITDTQIISPTIVNETRFQYIRDSDNQIPLSLDPTLVVQGAFTGGGSSSGTTASNQDHYELQNFTSIAHGKHFIKFGGRLRGTLFSSNENSGFNGAYNFSSLNAYQITVNGLEQGLTPAEIRALGGGASQFTLVAGQPLSDVSMVDVGLYAQDEWKIRPNVTLSYGLRYETQTGIPYEGNWAPRVSLAWGLGHSKTAPKTVLRGGYGIFYDRFSYDYILQAERYNGITQQQYVVANPNFYPLIPTPAQLATLATNSPTTYQVQNNLHVPYTMEAAFSVERQVTKNATVSVTYLNSRGIHQLFLRNANAPLPGTYPSQRRHPTRQQRQHLPVQLRRSLRAKPAHHQRAIQSWQQSFALWFLRAGLCQQRPRLGRANLDFLGKRRWRRFWRRFRRRYHQPAIHFKLLRSDAGLGARRIRRAQPRLCWRDNFSAICVSFEPVHYCGLGYAI